MTKKKWIVDIICLEISDKLKNHKAIISILLRGSKSPQFFNKKYSDVDISVVLKNNSNIFDIIKIKQILNKIGEKYEIPISPTIIISKQLIRDSSKRIHFHGTKDSSYSLEISEAKVILGKDLTPVFKRMNHYDIFSQYFNSCRFVNLFLKNIGDCNNKKGINYSFILAKECLLKKGVLVSCKEDIAKQFVHINKKLSKELFLFLQLRKKEKLSNSDLNRIYKFLIYCQNFLGREIDITKSGIRKFPERWLKIQE